MTMTAMTSSRWTNPSVGQCRHLALERQEPADLGATQVVGERPPGRVTGERLLFLEAAAPELDLAFGPGPPLRPKPMALFWLGQRSRTSSDMKEPGGMTKRR
jgi:hypothetical protein